MRNRGVLYMLTAVLFFAVMNVLIKWIPKIGVIEIVFFRSFISLILSYLVLSRQKISVWGNNKKWLLIRGGAGSVGLICFFATIKLMPLGSAVAIQYMSPIFTTMLGIYLLKERVFRLQWLFFGISFAGVLLIQGFDTRVTTGPLIIGLVGALAAGLAYNSIRKLKTSEHPLVIIFYFPLVTLPITTVYLIFHWVTPTMNELVILLAIGLSTQFAQYFMTRAYQNDAVSRISSIQYIGLVFAVAFGYYLFDETYSILSGLGILVLVLGVVLNVWYKNWVLAGEKMPND